jgi:hypothetical protein
MTNLFKSTVEYMKKRGYTEDDVLFVQHSRGHCTWEEFRLTMESHDGDYTNYDKSQHEFAIVGDSWKITFRHNYNDEVYSRWTHTSIKPTGDHVIPTVDEFIEKCESWN